MSVALFVSGLTVPQQEAIIEDLTITTLDPHLGLKKAIDDKTRCFFTHQKRVIVPYAYGQKYSSAIVPTPDRKELTFNPEFVSVPLTRQKQIDSGISIGNIRDQEGVVSEVLKRLPANNISKGSVFLNLPTGYGKTKLTVFLTTQWKRQVLVICHNQTVLDQWEEEYKTIGCKTVHLHNCDKLTEEDIPIADVYLCGVQSASNLKFDILNVGVVIYDEAHEATKTCCSQSLLRVRPDIVVFLTATAYRNDEYEKCFSFYVDEQNIIKRSIKKTFNVHKCLTGIEPKIRTVWREGRKELDYNYLLDSIHKDPKFISMLVKLINSIPSSSTEKLLVMFNRNKVLNQVSEKIQIPHTVINKDKGKDVPADHSVVLIIDKKGKLGLDIKGAKSLLMTYTVKDINQLQGRIRDDNFHLYLILHQHYIFENHYNKNIDFLKKLHAESISSHITTIDLTKEN